MILRLYLPWQVVSPSLIFSLNPSLQRVSSFENSKIPFPQNIEIQTAPQGKHSWIAFISTVTHKVILKLTVMENMNQTFDSESEIINTVGLGEHPMKTVWKAKKTTSECPCRIVSCSLPSNYFHSCIPEIVWVACSRHFVARGMFRLDKFPMTLHLVFFSRTTRSEVKFLLKRIGKGVRSLLLYFPAQPVWMSNGTRDTNGVQVHTTSVTNVSKDKPELFFT